MSGAHRSGRTPPRRTRWARSAVVVALAVAGVLGWLAAGNATPTAADNPTRRAAAGPTRTSPRGTGEPKIACPSRACRHVA